MKTDFFTAQQSPSSSYINRFLQPDSIIPSPANPQSLNRFSYVRNNPINSVDPTGHKECDDIDANGKCIKSDDSVLDKPIVKNTDKKDKGDQESLPSAACFQGSPVSWTSTKTGMHGICEELVTKNKINEGFDYFASFDPRISVSYNEPPDIVIGYSWGGTQAFSEALYHSDWKIKLLVLVDPVTGGRGDDYSDVIFIPDPLGGTFLHTGVIHKPSNVEKMIIILSEYPGGYGPRYSAGAEDATTTIAKGTDHSNVDEYVAKNIDLITQFLGSP